MKAADSDFVFMLVATAMQRSNKLQSAVENMKLVPEVSKFGDSERSSATRLSTGSDSSGNGVNQVEWFRTELFPGCRPSGVRYTSPVHNELSLIAAFVKSSKRDRFPPGKADGSQYGPRRGTMTAKR
jgi:hypothetical protein